MAGQFELLYVQSFSSVSSVTVTHNLDRLQVGVIARIGNVSRNDLIYSITPSISDPRNEVLVTFVGTQSGEILISDTDYIFANIPTPENAAQVNQLTSSAYAPGGADTQVQFNDGGSSFSGSANFTWLKASNVLSVTGVISGSGNISGSAFYGDGSNLVGVSSTPGGATTQIQFNDGGAFAGDADLVWDKTGNTLTIAGALSGSGNISGSAFYGDGSNLTGPIQESIVDAKGDLLVATGADTIVRLPVGANRQLLRADSTQTEGVGWFTSTASVYADYYDAGTTAIATSATTLGLDSSRQSDALFVLAADQITVQTGGAGDYLIIYDCSTNETSTGATGVAIWLENNGVEVVASRSHTEHFTSGTDNTCGSSQIVTLADGDVLRLRGQILTGTGTIDTLAGGVSLTIMAPGSTGPTGPTGAGSNVIVQDSGVTVTGGPHSTLNFTGAATAVDAGGGVATINLTEAKFANWYNNAAYSGITTSASTLPFPDTRISNAAFTIDGSGEEVTINTSGTYRIDYACSSEESSGADIVADMWLELDTGSGFAEVEGTRSRWFHDNNGEEGGNSGFAIIVLAATDVFRIRAQVVNGATDTLNTLANSLRLSIQTVGSNGADGATGATGPQGPSGSGSTIIVEDEGSIVAGGPHSNLDFVGSGVTVTNAGSGVATVTIPGGSSANIAQYRATANLSIATSPTTVPLNATDFEDSNYTRSGENITINTDGIYKISYTVFFTTTGNFRRTIEAWVENNTSAIVPSRSADYARNTADNEGSAGATFMVQLAESDVVRLRCESVGTSGTCQGEGNRMWICLEFMRAP